MKHIVHVHEKFYPFMGGSTHRLLNLIKNIDQKKYKITVICENSEDVELEEEYKGIKIIRYNKYTEILKILLKISYAEKIDLIHSHNFRPTFYASIINTVLRKKMIIEMHSIYKTSNIIKEALGWYFLKRIKTIIVLSENSKKYLTRVWRINDKKIKVIYNGIDCIKNEEIISTEDKTLNKILNEKNLKVLYMGSLDSFQGVDKFVEIANSYIGNQIEFIIIGGNKAEVAALRLNIVNPKIYCRSYIDKKYVNYIYKNADILLMTRPKLISTETAIPLKPLEALYNKLQVVSTEVGGMRELKETLKSKNIITFSRINELKKILKDYKKEFYNEEKLELFSTEFQSKKLEELYEELIYDNK